MSPAPRPSLDSRRTSSRHDGQSAVATAWHALLGATLVLALPACSEVTAPAAAARIAVLSATALTDTAGAVRPLLRLAVTTASGEPAPNVQLRIAELGGVSDDPEWDREWEARQSGAYAWVIPDGRQFVAGTATYDTTDAAGSVALRLRAGPISGTASFELSVPAAGIADTVRVRIEPGNPVALHLGSAQDTTLRVNAATTLTAYVLDRHGNRRLRDAVTFTSPEAELAVTADGRVTGLAPVRGRVVARAGALRPETTLVSVVPAGTLAVQRRRRDGTQLGTMALDGTGFTALSIDGAPSGFLDDVFDWLVPEWSVDGGAVFVNTLDALRRVELGGPQGVAAYRPNPTPWMQRISSVGGERIGGWVYYSVSCAGGELLYRTRPGAQGRTELLSPDAPDLPDEIDPLYWTCVNTRHEWPSPSPDGRRVVFTDETFGGQPARLAVLDVATRAVTRLGMWGYRPSWSPDGAWIAYWTDGALWLTRPDGSEAHRLPTPSTGFAPGVTWSPDGAWLIARLGEMPGRLVLVEARTGREIPLSYSYWKRPHESFQQWYALPTWRRQ
jgi:hypothetical protein